MRGGTADQTLPGPRAASRGLSSRPCDFEAWELACARRAHSPVGWVLIKIVNDHGHYRQRPCDNNESSPQRRNRPRFYGRPWNHQEKDKKARNREEGICTDALREVPLGQLMHPPNSTWRRNYAQPERLGPCQILWQRRNPNQVGLPRRVKRRVSRAARSHPLATTQGGYDPWRSILIEAPRLHLRHTFSRPTARFAFDQLPAGLTPGSPQRGISHHALATRAGPGHAEFNCVKWLGYHSTSKASLDALFAYASRCFDADFNQFSFLIFSERCYLPLK